MSDNRFTKFMWLILVVCVAAVTFIAKVFGLKVLIVLVVVVSTILYVVEQGMDNEKKNRREK